MGLPQGLVFRPVVMALLLWAGYGRGQILRQTLAPVDTVAALCGINVIQTVNKCLMQLWGRTFTK